MIEKVSYTKKAKLAYNPEDVNIRAQVFRLSAIIDMLNQKALDMYDEDFAETDFWERKTPQRQITLFGEDTGDENLELEIDEADDLQRNPALWNNVQKSRFIESLLINIPIPAFYFDGSQKPWRVVDGLQRLHTIRDYIGNGFKLNSLEYLQDSCGECYYHDDKPTMKTLPGYFRRRILDTQIVAYVINPGTPANVKYNIFKRINTGGLLLKGQEIRNAFFPGKPVELTKLLASSGEFKAATNHKVSSRRMDDREYANRFIAFQLFSYKDYNGKMEVFLSEAMDELYERTAVEFSEIEETFKKAMRRAYELLGNYAFYRPGKGDKEWGRQPNKALFDTLAWNLGELKDDEFEALINQITEFRTFYRSFMNIDPEMFKAINDTTSSKPAVINRITRLKDFIKQFL